MPEIDSLFIAFQSALAGRYSLERELGRGGMGVVYLAREVRLDRSVAIKLLPPELAGDARLRDRFIREARLAARLSHPYIVPIHSVDEVGDFVFYAMAYVDGETLAQRVRTRGPLPPHEATRIIREVAWALAYAHAQGIVHRDIKPANILIERGTERAMVMDFGIARLGATAGETSVGELLGTPEYMSPEQASGDPVDGRSDLYSLGVTAYFALTGALPFSGSSAQAVLAQLLTKPAPSLATTGNGMPRSVVQAVDRCLEKDPAARFATGEALADALAPARDNVAEIPIPIRVFLDRRRMAPLIVPSAMLVPMSIGVIARVAEKGGSLIAPVAILGAAAAVAISFPLVLITYRLRRVLRLGYGTPDIVAGLRAQFARRREEFLYEFGTQLSTREKVLRVASFTAFAAAAGLAGALGAGVLSPKIAVPFSVISMYAGVISGVLGLKWRRMRKLKNSRWIRFWEGRFGQTLTRVAEFRLGHRALPADRPTEMAIAMSAEALFASFPKAIRQSLGDVPEVLGELERRARGIRARISSLDGALSEAQASRTTTGERQLALVADLREARAVAEKSLSDVVTALENLRLDLLRLSAGAGSAEGVTQNVIAARELGAGVDRLLAGQREVEEALRGDRGP